MGDMKVAKRQLVISTPYGPYKIVLEPEPDMGGYMITVPKRPDVISWGENLAHAKRMAKEAIECSVEGEVLIAAEKEGVIVMRKQRLVA